MNFLTISMAYFRVSQAALNARSFCTNDSAVRWGGLAYVSLDGTPSRLGGEPSDRIGWGRLRSSAFAEGFGFHSLLNVGCAVACYSGLTQKSGTHVGSHADPHDRQFGGGASPSKQSAYTHSRPEVSGARLGRHFARHIGHSHVA